VFATLVRREKAKADGRFDPSGPSLRGRDLRLGPASPNANRPQAGGDYHPRYEGGARERDGGYHQGPVWGWMLGHFALATFRVTGEADAALALLAPMHGALTDQGLGKIVEIFDGDPPHDPRGAPAQAWSVACTLQAWQAVQARRTLAKGL
jgi:hypothetical protein